jgi:hypothetical protein
MNAVLPVRIRMRRKAVKAVVMHTKDSIQHLKDDDDEMLRGKQVSCCKPPCLKASKSRLAMSYVPSVRHQLVEAGVFPIAYAQITLRMSNATQGV